jgi:hypothetical protein
MKTRIAYGTLKSTGKLVMSQDTVEEALKAKMMVRDYEKELVKLNPQLDIRFNVVKYDGI